MVANGVPFYGSMGGKHLSGPIVGMATDTATGGYWEVAADGGVFTFHAPFYGSMGGQATGATGSSPSWRARAQAGISWSGSTAPLRADP